MGTIWTQIEKRTTVGRTSGPRTVEIRKFPSLSNHEVYYIGFDMLDHLAATIPVFDSRRALSLMSWDMDAHARVRVCSTPASACARVSVAAFSKSSGRASFMRWELDAAVCVHVCMYVDIALL